MVSVCTVPARGGRSCEHFGGYKTINRIPLPFLILGINYYYLTLAICSALHLSMHADRSPTILFFYFNYL